MDIFPEFEKDSDFENGYYAAHSYGTDVLDLIIRFLCSFFVIEFIAMKDVLVDITHGTAITRKETYFPNWG